MSSNDIKTNLKDRNEANSHKETAKHSLLLSLYIFILWVIGIGLLLSLLASLPSSPHTFVIFIIKEGSQ